MTPQSADLPPHSYTVIPPLKGGNSYCGKDRGEAAPTSTQSHTVRFQTVGRLVETSNLKTEFLDGMAAGLGARCPHLFSSNCFEAWQLGAAVSRGIAFGALDGAELSRVWKGRGDKINATGTVGGRPFKAVFQLEYLGHGGTNASLASFEREAASAAQPAFI